MERITLKEFKNKRKANARKRHSMTMYVKVANNVYYDGYSFRVRVTKDYTRTSRNFPCIGDAIRFRDSLQKEFV